MEKIKVGIIGCGRTANELHAKVLEKHTEFETVACYNKTRWKAEKLAERLGAKVLDTYEEFVNCPDFDLAIILTYSDCHAPIAYDCMKAGKDVLITKPWALDLEWADKLIETSKETGKKVIPFVPCHWGCDIHKLKELMAENAIGKVFQVRRQQVTFGRRNDWQMYKEHGGGYLNNWGPHLIEQVLDFVGEPIKSVYAETKLVVNPGDTEDMFYAVLKSVSGIVVTVEHNIMTNGLPNWVVQGDRGTIYIKENEMDMDQISYPETDDKDAYRSPVDVKRTHITLEGKRFGDHYDIYTDIAKYVRNEADYAITLEHARHLTEVMCAIHESADTHKLVEL